MPETNKKDEKVVGNLRTKKRVMVMERKVSMVGSCFG